jgi:superfamily I DNA and/or RNA helicase
VAGGTDLKRLGRVDDLIVDEAAAATEPELCIPLYLQPRRLLAVGDPRQLPATVTSLRAAELGLNMSLHQRLMDECGYKPIMLNVQYRMHAEISLFPSARFYHSQLLNAPNVSSLYRNGALLLHRSPYSFLKVAGAEQKDDLGSSYNQLEAHHVADLIFKLQSVFHRESAWHGPDRIRVITFYQAQVSAIQQCLQHRGLGDLITVATVDASQGCEADVVIVSFVRSRQDMGAGDSATAGFLTDDRRINVALTRAKFQLICVGNVDWLAQLTGDDSETLRELAVDATRRGRAIRSE